jgi:hypothetical protein
MSRQKKSKGLPPWLIVLLLLLLALAAYFGSHGGVSDAALRTIEPLNTDLYYSNANSLRGNTYKIDSIIDSTLGNSPSKGRLFSVILNKSKPGDSESILPILVPPELGNLTIQKGQHYLMKVKVEESGLLKVETAIQP